MRLIDADTLPKVTECCVDEAGFFAKFNVVHEEDIQKAPTIDPKNLSPHGRWIWELADNGWANYICSNCGYTRNVDVHIVMDWGYCPNCGADMRKGENDA